MTYSPVFQKALGEFVALDESADILTQRYGDNAANEALRIMSLCIMQGQGEEACFWETVNQYLRQACG